MKIGTITYATRQGLGYLGKSFYEAGVITHPILYRHPQYANQYDWYPKGTPVVASRAFSRVAFQKWLKGIDLMLFFETPFQWDVLPLCKEMGIKTALVPMYEWTLTKMPHPFDLIVAPSLLDRDYFPGSVFIPIPVRTDLWKKRTVAKRFLHNAGHIGHREHKGTRQLLEAVKYVTSDLTLTIRCQSQPHMKKLLKEVGWVDKPWVTFEYGDLPYTSLWDDYDVLVAPEKFNGLSLPLQEGLAAGMVVMASDRYPHNTWLPREYLVPVLKYQKARVNPSYMEFDEAIIEPMAIAETMDRLYGKDISGYSEAARNWALDNSWEVLKPQYLEVFHKCLSS